MQTPVRVREHMCTYTYLHEQDCLWTHASILGQDVFVFLLLVNKVGN